MRSTNLHATSERQVVSPNHLTQSAQERPLQSVPTPSQAAIKATKALRARHQLKFITNAATQVELQRNKDGIPTIYFEQASIKKVSNVRQGDWENKIIFQITAENELYQLADFLTGRLQLDNDKLEFKYHGKGNNKSLSIIKNKNNGQYDGSIMVSLSEGGSRYSGVIHPTGIIQMTTLIFKAFAARFGISVTDAIAILNKCPVSEAPKA